MIEEFDPSWIDLRSKLILVFVLVALLVGLTGLIGYQNVDKLDHEAHLIAKDGENMDHAAEMVVAIEKQEIGVLGAELGRPNANEEYREGAELFEEHAGAYEPTTEKERKVLSSLRSKHTEFNALAEEYFEAKRAGKDELAARKLEEMEQLRPEMEEQAKALEESAQQDLEAQVATADSTTRTAQKEFIVLTVVALIAAIGLGVVLTRHIASPLDRMSRAAEAIARGELDGTVEETDRGDEIGDLTNAFSSMQDYLNTVASQAEAIADQRFDAAVLDEDVPGTFGETIDRMSHDIEQAQREIEELNEELEAKAADYSAVMGRAAEGDLTSRMDPDSRNDAMRRIGETFNEMMDGFEGTVARIRRFADDVAHSSQEVTTSTEEVRNASEQVSESVQEISAGADTQNDNFDEVSSEMQNLSGMIEEVASSADEVASTAQQAAEIGQAGSESATNAIEDMSAIRSKTEETMGEVESLADEIEEIGEIVEMITDIAEQTNLLALNASIEAARAGEAGEGFAVVADEIKSLAEETAEATEEIEALITEIQSSTTDTVEDMREMGKRVSSGTETIKESLEALDEIAEHVEQANDGIQEISEATDEQATSTEEVVDMVDEVSGVAEQTSAEAANVSAAAEEQVSSLTEVSDNAQSLSQRAEELQEMLDEFAVSDRSSDIAGTGPDSDRTPQATADGGQSGPVSRGG